LQAVADLYSQALGALRILVPSNYDEQEPRHVGQGVGVQ
jgi:hypothetical protein